MRAKMTVKEHLHISRRAIQMLYSLSPAYVYALVSDSLVKALLPYAPIYFSAKLIDALAAGAPLSTLVLYAALGVGIPFGLHLLHFWLKAQKEIGSSKVYQSHEWCYAEKAMHLAYASIEDREVSLLCDRIRTETDTGYNLFYLTNSLENLVQTVTQIIASVSLTASFFMLDTIALWSKFAFVSGIALSVTVSVLINRKTSGLRMAIYSEWVPMNILLYRFTAYIGHYTTEKDIRLYHMEEGLTASKKALYDQMCDREQSMRLRCAGMNLVSTVLNYALRFGVYLILVATALHGGLSVGSIAQYVSCLMLFMAAIAALVSTWQLSLVNHTYLQRYFSYFDIPNNMKQGTLSVEKRNDNEYDIEFRNVSFRYPNTETYALRHVSLSFRIGEKLAVVGMNGSGKTTFIKLLCRLYDPTEGEILLNGVDIRKYDYREYLSLFSVVFQDFRLFAFPLGQNVAAGARYDRAKAEACLREAGFGERLAQMPQGTDTILYHDFDKNGIEISGGEAQKIALARALYKDAPFMILDEPTAALDPLSEYEVYRKFNDLSGGKTAVYISHRLASCRFCDKIAVFDGGQIIQCGTHTDLLSDAEGKYAELWHAQAQYYTEGQKPDSAT